MKKNWKDALAELRTELVKQEEKTRILPEERDRLRTLAEIAEGLVDVIASDRELLVRATIQPPKELRDHVVAFARQLRELTEKL